MSVNSSASLKSATPETPAFSFSELPEEILVNISVRTVTPETLQAPGFWLTDKHTAAMAFGSDGLMTKAMPEQCEYRKIQSADVEARPTVAAKFLLSLRPTLRPVYVRRVFDIIPEIDGSGVPLRGKAASGVVAACLLAPGKAADDDSDKYVKDLLNVRLWDEWMDIPGMPFYAITTFKGNQELVETALAGLWNAWFSEGLHDHRWHTLFAYAICETMLQNPQTTNVELLVRIVTDPSVATQTEQFDALKTLDRFNREQQNREPQFNWLIGGLSLLEEKSGKEVLQYLSCLAPALPQDGDPESAAADWLSASIALAVRKGVDAEQIQAAIPPGKFSDRFVNAAIRHASRDHAASTAQTTRDASGQTTGQ